MDSIYLFDLPWIVLDKIVHNLSFIDRIKFSISYPPIKRLVRKKQFDFKKYLYKKLISKIGIDLTIVIFNKLNKNNFIFGNLLFECLLDLELKSDIVIISNDSNFNLFSGTNFKWNNDLFMYKKNNKLIKHNIVHKKCITFEKINFLFKFKKYNAEYLSHESYSINEQNWRILVNKFGKNLILPYFDSIFTLGMITFDGKHLSIKFLDDMIFKKYSLLDDEIIIPTNTENYHLVDLIEKIDNDLKKFNELGFKWNEGAYKKHLNLLIRKILKN